MDMKKIKDYAGFVVFAHILIAGLDHLAHQHVDLRFSLAGNIMTFSIIATPPLMAGALFLTKFQRAGAILLLSTMGFAFVYSAYTSYVSPHKMLLAYGASPLWESVFYASSSLLLILEVIGCWIAIKALRVLQASDKKDSSENSQP